MLEIDEARGNPLPEWALDAPEIAEGETWLLSAFRDLSTERWRSDRSIGPIPWSKTELYSEKAGLDSETRRIVHAVISALDTRYIEWFSEAVKDARPMREKDDDRE